MKLHEISDYIGNVNNFDDIYTYLKIKLPILFLE